MKPDDAGFALPWAVQLLLAALLLAMLVAGYVLNRRRAGSAGPAALMAGWLRAPGPDGLAQSQRPMRLVPGTSLHVVRWGAEELLLACGANGVQVLARRPCADAQPAGGTP